MRKLSHQVLEAGDLAFQVAAGAQGGLEVFHAFLVEQVDLVDVDVERLDHRGLLLGGGRHRQVYAVDLADALGHAAQALADLQFLDHLLHLGRQLMDAMGEVTHLVGNHGEAAPGFPSAPPRLRC
jgi:hypothetical protein